MARELFATARTTYPIAASSLVEILPLPKTVAANLQRLRCKLRANLQLQSTPGTSSSLQDHRDLATRSLPIAGGI
jgi:hypothetical protein